MKRKVVILLYMSLLLVALLGVFAGGVAQAQDMKVLYTGVGMTSGDPNSLDPALAQDTKEIAVINALMPGMTIINEVTTALEPGIAESWDVSDDGLVYTFHLRTDISWVRYNAESGEVEQIMDENGNPRMVTAHDVVYGWRRALDPATASIYVYVLAPYVVNGAEFNSGAEGVTAEDVGVVALDDFTVQITSPTAGAFLANIYGMWFARPVPQWAIEAAGDRWTEPENTATYGPFVFQEWAHDEYVMLGRNPFWPGTDYIPVPALDQVVMRFIDDTVQFAEYQAGSIDAINVPQAELPRVRADANLSEQYSTGTDLCTYYYGFNVEKDPFTNAHMRRAFSYAIDRQSIVDNVTQGGQIPARWFSRPGLVAAPTPETHPDLGISFDPAMAQAELALGLEELGLGSVAELPPITLAFGDTTGHTRIAQAVQQMWTDTLGITVQLAAQDVTTYFANLHADAPQIFRSGWCLDYPDADNFLRVVFRSDSGQNDPNYNNPAYDALVDQAALMTNTAERTELYAQAETLLVVEDAAVAPIYWYTTNQLTQPYVIRTYSITGGESYWNWDISQ